MGKITVDNSGPIGLSIMDPYNTTSIPQWATHYVGSKAEDDFMQDLMKGHDDSKNDIETLKDVTKTQEVMLTQFNNQLYDIREQVKEALMIIKYPGLIANRVLDKVDSFIAKHKRVLTDSTGAKIEMVEVSRLNEMVEQLREVVKNGNNNERL